MIPQKDTFVTQIDAHVQEDYFKNIFKAKTIKRRFAYLESTAQLDRLLIVDDDDPEVGRLEDLLEQLAHRQVLAAWKQRPG